MSVGLSVWSKLTSTTSDQIVIKYCIGYLWCASISLNVSLDQHFGHDKVSFMKVPMILVNTRGRTF